MRNVEDYVHMTSAVLTGMAPAAVILKHYRYLVVDGLEYIVSGATFMLITMLMLAHSKHQDSLNQQVHLQMGILWFLLAVTMYAETVNMDKPVYPIIRGFLLIYLGGLWIQADFILWNMDNDKRWPPEDHFYLFLETMTMAWHFIGAIMVTCIVNFIVLFLVKRLTASQVRQELDISKGAIQALMALPEGERRSLRQMECNGVGAFHANGTSELVSLKGNQCADDYVQTFEDHLLPVIRHRIRRSAIFQQDNASICTARTTKAFFKRAKVRVMDWPAKSPDLNPIENVWGYMAGIVYACWKQYDTKEELELAIQAAWSNLDPNYLHYLA
ncbi:uncharacterized protein LOC108665834 [Hyalella azteca]|uniref:Uncharacterized protein LOC108665834 n=1 Tax=Hyalella azteca TaxID=294128 RepID=A0A979FKB2_HYAAZ|nr:uncharacterized protein LOC108665834 [Hyalella azteca]